MQMSAELTRKIPGADWNFSQNIRDNVMEAMSGVKGDNSVKIFGPDLEELDRLAEQVQDRLRQRAGHRQTSACSASRGRRTSTSASIWRSASKWGVSAADVNNVIQTALGGKALSTMIEGEKSFDITVRWPLERRGSEATILDMPVDVTNNQVVAEHRPER